MLTTELTLRVSETAGDVAALLQRPSEARWLLVLAHGAGAGMRHAFMETLAGELATAGVATLRYQFPYMQQKRAPGARPDPPAVLTATVRAAIAAAAEASPDLPLLAGGKSLGGRILDGADHSFHVLKRSGRNDADVLRDLAETTASWADSLGRG